MNKMEGMRKMINKNNVLQRGMKTRKVGFEEFNTIQESYKYDCLEDRMSKVKDFLDCIDCIDDIETLGEYFTFIMNLDNNVIEEENKIEVNIRNFRLEEISEIEYKLSEVLDFKTNFGYDIDIEDYNIVITIR